MKITARYLCNCYLPTKQNIFLIKIPLESETMATKRSNPFIEDFMPQSKVHVGLKQFNNNEDRLKKVYDKTLELLFKGAKKPLHQESDVINNNVLICNKKDGMKQLVIGKDGSLLNSTIKVLELAATTFKQCTCGNTMEANCGYCERELCLGCQQFCNRCEKNYCSHCSLNGCEGGVVCVSCYS